jgi:hypothetical protein
VARDELSADRLHQEEPSSQPPAPSLCASLTGLPAFCPACLCCRRPGAAGGHRAVAEGRPGAIHAAR